MRIRAKRTIVDGIVFASRGEARRYQELKLLEKAKQITALKLQPRFKLKVNEVLIGHYTADFAYIEKQKSGVWLPIIEEYKGFKTSIYRLRIKVFKALYPQIIFRETTG